MKPVLQLAAITLVTLLTCTGFADAQNVLGTRKYRVTAYKNGNPSVTSLSNTVEVVPYMSVYIPNSFTPNGDGLNDTFGAYGEAIGDFSLQVFNRWGEMIFESASFNQRWDGTFDGVKVPQGSYIYKLSAKGLSGNREDRKGTVTVVY